jgi:hypothetical protein
MDEMFSPISKQIMPSSIEERINMYKLRNTLEEKNTKYKIIKQKFLNYRQFNFKLTKGKSEHVPAYALSYSTLLRKKAQGKIQYNIDDVYYFNREEIKLISLETFNKLGNFNFKNIYELIFNAPTIDEEFSIRNSINSSAYDLSPIIIVEQIIDSKLNIYLDSKIYEDIREKLIIF